MRTSWDGVPDRGSHVYNPNKSGGSLAGDADQAAVAKRTVIKETVPEGPIQGAERYYKVESGERLYQIAQRYGVSLYWLIKRNDLSDLPRPGQKLIVPGPAVQ